jgi:hypothetical protein
MKLIWTTFFVGCSTVVLSQQIGPANWKTESDFRAEEQNVAANILWLEENPIATGQNDTKAITEYVLKWLTDTPYLSITLDAVFLENIVNQRKFKYGEKFRVTYLFGKAIYHIENQDQINEVEASTRGIIGMVKVYNELRKFDPSIRNRTLEKYTKMYSSGRLQSYVTATLNKSTTL